MVTPLWWIMGFMRLALFGVAYRLGLFLFDLGIVPAQKQRNPGHKKNGGRWSMRRLIGRLSAPGYIPRLSLFGRD